MRYIGGVEPSVHGSASVEYPRPIRGIHRSNAHRRHEKRDKNPCFPILSSKRSHCHLSGSKLSEFPEFLPNRVRRDWPEPLGSPGGESQGCNSSYGPLIARMVP